MSKAVIDALVARFPGAVTGAYQGVGGDAAAFVEKGRIVEVATSLKADGFDLAPYITAVDYLGQEPRFEVVYCLYSTKLNARIRLRVKVAESDPVVPTVTGVWRGADWPERYCLDMYGLRFTGHPDPRRLFMQEEFVGHPLRKDYPLRGRQPILGECEGPQDAIRGPGPATRS
ncbi:MAG: NADH-quinone oxidoreductase subunit C [Anaeromyxobacteraceae bacterium]